MKIFHDSFKKSKSLHVVINKTKIEKKRILKLINMIKQMSKFKVNPYLFQDKQR